MGYETKGCYHFLETEKELCLVHRDIKFPKLLPEFMHRKTRDIQPTNYYQALQLLP